jgi:hypothetical protein
VPQLNVDRVPDLAESVAGATGGDRVVPLRCVGGLRQGAHDLLGIPAAHGLRVLDVRDPLVPHQTAQGGHDATAERGRDRIRCLGGTAHPGQRQRGDDQPDADGLTRAALVQFVE